MPRIEIRVDIADTFATIRGPDGAYATITIPAAVETHMTMLLLGAGGPSGPTGPYPVSATLANDGHTLTVVMSETCTHQNLPTLASGGFTTSYDEGDATDTFTYLTTPYAAEGASIPMAGVEQCWTSVATGLPSAAFSSFPVTNNSTQTAPTVTAATIDETTLTITFSQAVDGHAGFGVTIGGSSTGPTYTGGEGTDTYTYSPTSPPAYGDTVTLSYNSGAGDVLGHLNAFPLASFGGFPVTNNVPAPPPFATQRISFGPGGAPTQSGCVKVNTAYNGTSVPVGFDSGTTPGFGYNDRGTSGLVTSLGLTDPDFYRQQAITGQSQLVKINVAVPTGSSVQIRAYYFDSDDFSDGPYTMTEYQSGSPTGNTTTTTVVSANGPDTGVLTLTDSDNDGVVQVGIQSNSYASINGVDVATVGNLPTAWS